MECFHSQIAEPDFSSKTKFERVKQAYFEASKKECERLEKSFDFDYQTSYFASEKEAARS